MTSSLLFSRSTTAQELKVTASISAPLGLVLKTLGPTLTSSVMVMVNAIFTAQLTVSGSLQSKTKINSEDPRKTQLKQTILDAE